MKTAKQPPVPNMKKIPPKSKPPVFKPEDYTLSGLHISQIQQFKQVFDLYDMQKAGRIDPKELKNIITSCGMQSKNRTFYQLICSLQKQGPIDFNKFLQIMSARSGLKKTKPNLKKLFQIYDHQKSGFITQQSLKNLVKDLNLKLTDQEIKDMIIRADLNKDEQVSEDEFYLIMTKK